MKKTNKLLALVLSLAMALSCITVPMTVSAADGDFIYKYTFDEAADATGVFGTGAGYQVVAGTYPSTKHASAANLGADDKIAMLTPTNKGTTADGSAGSYLFGTNWGDKTNARHATIQFDMQLNTGWNTFKFYPASTEGCSARLGFDITSETDAAQPLRAVNANGWDYTNMGTISRHTWYEFAIEYDLDAGKAILYKDGVAIHTIEGVTGTATPNDFIFQYGGENANGAVYVNNLYYYEGGYNANIVDPVYPYIERDYTSTDDIENSLGQTSTGAVDQADGLAGKAASDKVLKLTGGHTGWTGGTYTDNVLTAEAQILVAADKKIELYPGGQVSGGEDDDRPGVYINCGKFGYVNAKGWGYSEKADVDTTIWHKVAVEWNRSDATAKVYLDGVLMHTETGITYDSQGFNKDIRFQDNGYIDNYRVYAGPYVADATIPTPSLVADGEFVIAEDVTLADAKATVTDGTAEFYTDDTYSTVATTVETAKFVLINKGELYAAYPVKSSATEEPTETETPATETPATETPATETPATEAPATEAPATEAPTAAPTLPPLSIDEDTIINEYYFDTDTNTPWTGGSIVAGTDTGKAEADKVYNPSGASGNFAGYNWDGTTGLTKTTLQFDAYFTAATGQLKIWGASSQNKNRPAIGVKATDGALGAGMMDGWDWDNNGAVLDTPVPLNQWVRFAIEYDVDNSTATLYNVQCSS